jgi:hypothetical protein
VSRSSNHPALLLLALAACSSSGGAPEIVSFTAQPALINAGQSSTLAWTINGASTVTIDNNVGDVTSKSSVQVTPAATTTYQIRAVGNGGDFSLATVTVTVSGSGGGPVINSFTASPSSVGSGSSSTLAWSVTGFTTLAIDNGVGDVSSKSSVQVTPTATTTYTLTATGSGGTSTATAQVAVVSPGLRLDYTDPASTSGKLVAIKRNSSSTQAHLVLDVIAVAALPAAFGVALNLPLDHTRAQFAPSTGLTLPASPVINPGTGSGATLGAARPSVGALADLLTVGVARKKSVASDGDLSVPAGTVLFSLAFDVVASPQAPDGVLFDGASLPAKARLGVLKKDGSAAASTADFAVGQMFVTH